MENGRIARLAAAEARKRRRLRVENAAETIHAFMRSARAREERERITRRAAAKARKRAKVAARRERMHFGSDLDGSTEADALSGGDVKLAGDANSGGDAIIAKQRKRVKTDATSGGDKCESFSGDGMGPTFFGGSAECRWDRGESSEAEVWMFVSRWGRERVCSVLLLSGRPWSKLKGALVGSSISSGRTTS